MRIGEKIKELRISHGYTLSDLSEYVVLDRTVINKIELGTRPVRDDEIKIFANFFHVSADFLLDINGKNTEKPPNKPFLQKLFTVASRSSKKNILVATNLLEQLNEDNKA